MTDIDTHIPAPDVTPKRINVAVNGDELRAIDLVIEREGVTLTEAVRRLIGYGEWLYRSAKVDGMEIIERGGDGNERAVILI
jgi:hypothetical protein